MNLRTKTVAVTILSIALILLLWFAFETKQRVEGVESQWVDHHSYIAAINCALARINTNFDYSGDIHQTDDFPTRIELALAETYKAIEAYLKSWPKLKVSMRRWINSLML
jgi:hypothetical protein